MKRVYLVGIALIVAGVILYALKESGAVKKLPELFTTHAVAVSLILSGLVVVSTQAAQRAI